MKEIGMGELRVRPAGPADAGFIRAALDEFFGGTLVVSRGVLQDPTTQPGFVAELDGERIGFATYRIDGDECELTAIAALREGAGAGTALLAACADAARAAGCRRIWLVTTNDNIHALRFYQRRGWDIAALHRDAVTRSRALKPSIAFVGADGIPLRHELELELIL
jgi:ribosomal protein S18 acetylase RimI-like enzyme